MGARFYRLHPSLLQARSMLGGFVCAAEEGRQGLQLRGDGGVLVGEGALRMSPFKPAA